MAIAFAGDPVEVDPMNFLDTLIEGPWAAYSPNWFATVNPAIGNGTLGGRYQLMGKTVNMMAFITMGSTTTYGSNTGWTVGLPVTGAFSNSAPAPVFTAVAIDTSASTHYCLSCLLDNTARVIMRGHALTVTVGATSPFTWASTDVLRISGTYELA